MHFEVDGDWLICYIRIYDNGTKRKNVKALTVEQGNTVCWEVVHLKHKLVLNVKEKRSANTGYDSNKGLPLHFKRGCCVLLLKSSNTSDSTVHGPRSTVHLLFVFNNRLNYTDTALYLFLMSVSNSNTQACFLRNESKIGEWGFLGLFQKLRF